MFRPFFIAASMALQVGFGAGSVGLKPDLQIPGRRSRVGWKNALYMSGTRSGCGSQTRPQAALVLVCSSIAVFARNRLGNAQPGNSSELQVKRIA